MDETRDQIMGEITALKSLLRDTDYEVTKYAEGLTDCTTQAEIEAYREAFMEQYGEIIESRKAWRAKIRELDKDPKAMEKIARERYFMKADDEDIFVLSDDQREPEPVSHETTESDPEGR